MNRVLLVFLLLFTIIALLWGVFNYFILPKAIDKLQNSISENTLYQIYIQKPRYHLTGIELPEIKIVTSQGEFKAQSVKLHLLFHSLLKFNPAVKGKAIVVIGHQKTEVKIIRMSYSLKAKTGHAHFSIPAISGKDILRLINTLELKFPPDLRIAGNSAWEISFDWGKSHPVKLELEGESSDLKGKYQTAKFNIQDLNLKIKIDGKTYRIEGEAKDVSLSIKNKKVAFLKDIKINGHREVIIFNAYGGALENKPFSGEFKLILNKENSGLKYDLQIAEVSIQGKGYVEENTFKTEGQVDQISYSGEYTFEDKKIHLSACGSINIEKLSSILAVKNKFLNSISGTIEFKNLSLFGNIRDKNILAHLTSKVRNLKYKDKLIVEDSYIDAEMKNHILRFQNLELYPGNGKISITGSIIIKKPFNFSGQMMINSVPLGRFISLFTSRDVGDASLFASGVFNGSGDKIMDTEAQFNWRFENGDLGKIKLLTQLGELLARPDLARISFQRGEGKLILQKENMFIPQAVFISPMVNLYLQGKISLSGELNLIVVTEFAQLKEKEESSTLDALQKILLQGLSQLVYKIRITGTIKEPEYIVIPATVDDLLKNLLP